MKFYPLLFLLFICLACQEQEPSQNFPSSSSAELPDGIELSQTTSIDGLSLNYRHGGKGEVALVFVHGWCIDGSYFDAQLAHLSDRYQVVAIDLAGHGKSGRERKAWTIRAFAEDVKRVVDEMGLKKVLLVGHSMGDMVVTEASRLMPEKVIGLIGIDTFFEPEFNEDSTEFNLFKAQLRAEFATTSQYWIGPMFPPETDSSVFNYIMADISQSPVEVGVGTLQALFDYSQEGGFMAALKETRIPIRTINAGPPDTAAWAAIGIDFKNIPLEGVGHYPMKEDPEQLNSKLDAVLKEWEN